MDITLRAATHPHRHPLHTTPSEGVSRRAARALLGLGVTLLACLPAAAQAPAPLPQASLAPLAQSSPAPLPSKSPAVAPPQRPGSQSTPKTPYKASPEAPSKPAEGFPTLREFTQREHGYRLHLPAGWNLHAPSGPNDTADVRFGVLPSCRAFVQVYEGATTYGAQSWYLMARQRYTQAVHAHPSLGKLEVSALSNLNLGSRPAHQFDMTTTSKSGEQTRTRVIFAITSGPEGRVDVVELFVVASPDELRQREGELKGLLRSFEWLEPGLPVHP